MAGNALGFTATFGNVLSIHFKPWSSEVGSDKAITIFTDGSPSYFRFRIPNDISQMMVDGVLASHFTGSPFRLIDPETYLVSGLSLGRPLAVTIPRMLLAPALAEEYGLKPPSSAPKPAKR